MVSIRVQLRAAQRLELGFRSQQLGLSFADCSVLVTAARRGAEVVATFDKAFLGVEGIEVAGASGE